MATTTTNNRNGITKLTQANATLSGPNATILSEMEAMQKMMATLSHQVYTIDTTKNNSVGSGDKTNKYARCLNPPHYTVCHTDGASTLAKNAPERGLDTLILQQKIIIRVETHGASDMKGQVILQ